MSDMWYRQGNVRRFLPVPGVTVAVFMGKWTAFLHNAPMKGIPASKSIDAVKRAVWEYFDKRVNL